MTRHMPDNGFQVVMFTHQDVGVWADLAEILWAAGLQVTAGWCVATETESATRVGNYVQGTVLLVLRKRLGNEAGLHRPAPAACRGAPSTPSWQTMRALDHGEEPNFGDADYQLGAYAAALEVLTRYGTIDGRPVAAEVLRERRKGEESEVERLLRRAVRIASDFLVPEGFARDTWNELGPEERFYVKGLDLERAGEGRSAAYQEMARGFGVESYRPMLGSTAANKVRLKTAKEFGRRDLKRAGSQDRAEDRELEGFAGGLVRHVLYGIHTARESRSAQTPLELVRHRPARLLDPPAARDRAAGLLRLGPHPARAAGSRDRAVRCAVTSPITDPDDAQVASPPAWSGCPGDFSIPGSKGRSPTTGSPATSARRCSRSRARPSRRCGADPDRLQFRPRCPRRRCRARASSTSGARASRRRMTSANGRATSGSRSFSTSNESRFGCCPTTPSA